MEKKLYYKIDDDANECWAVMSLSGCAPYIEAEAESLDKGETNRKWIITPIWLTEEEFQNLPTYD